MNFTKWFRPGLKVKRWIIFGIIGLFIFSMGISPVLYELGLLNGNFPINLLLVITGIVIIIVSIKKGITSLLIVVSQHRFIHDISRDSVNKMFYRKRILIKGPKIVVIGGGTGLSVLLSGLKEYTSNITAIVTVADDGGGSGILREDLGMLPPGDIRSCIIALADTEPTMEKLLQHRFREGKLKGQSFGNLFIAAMNEIYGNFERAIQAMSSVLAVTGRVLPMTLEDVRLYAKLKNGQIIQGESNISEENKTIGSKIDYVYIEPKDSLPVKEALEAIESADGIVFGPGSLYTSVIPNLLIKTLSDKIKETNAIKIYVPNVMTQPGETDAYNVQDHVQAILKHSSKEIIDYVIANTEDIPKETLEKYILDGAQQVLIDDEQEEYLKTRNIEVIKGDLIDIKKDYIRHDALKLSEIIIGLVIDRKLKKERLSLFDLYFKISGSIKV